MALDWYDIEKFVDDNEESILIYDDNNYIARVPTLKTTSTFNEIREWRNQTIQIIGLGVTGIIEFFSIYSLKNPKPLNYKARNKVEDILSKYSEEDKKEILAYFWWSIKLDIQILLEEFTKTNCLAKAYSNIILLELDKRIETFSNKTIEGEI
jgi:hypothetical protein